MLVVDELDGLGVTTWRHCIHDRSRLAPSSRSEVFRAVIT
jgi:hypothetical protein